MEKIRDEATREDRFIDRLLETIEKQKTEIFRLRSVIENLPGSIYWKDKNGVYTGRNSYAMEKMQSLELEHNSQKDDLVGKTDYDFFSKEVAENYRKCDQEVMRTRKELLVEEPVTLPDGSTIVQFSIKRPLYNEEGEVVGIVGNTVDITHLKKIEADLRAAKEKAEEVNLVKTEFMRNMEHDIRTPLTGIWGIANLLLENEKDEVKKEYLSDAAQCAKELLDYCNGILDFSKIESGVFTLTDKKFNLQKLLNSVIKIELPVAKLKNLKLKIEYDSSIPKVLVGDNYRLNRVLINLVSNAIKFTQSGHIVLKVVVLKKTENTILLRFIVEDSGVGIPKDKQEYIFEKFSRLTLSNKGFYKGIGAGLRVVKQFMHEMGGEIDLLSEVGKGTQFICTIPFNLPLTDDFVE